MKSRWSDSEFRSVVDGYVRSGLNPDLATRVYTTRLLGADPQLVLHGGGNTSVKTTAAEADGSEVEVLCVKGSGWDMGTIEPAGLPAVRLKELAALARFDALSDIEMVRQQRRLLINPSAPNPSVEAILHALIPSRHVDHTHANAIVALTNQPDGEALVAEVFPDSVVVPYVMPGFDLAKACAKALAAAPGATSMVLMKHGIFTWSDDPRASYEAMIELVDRAERRLAQGRPRPFTAAPQPKNLASPAEIMPLLRGRLATPTAVDGRPKRMVLTFRASPAILDLCNAVNAADLVSRGNATPDHILHIKRTGVALPAPEAGKLDAFVARLELGACRLRRRVSGLFRAQQRPRRRRPGHARSASASFLRGGPRDLRRRRLGKGGEGRRRHRRGDRRRDHQSRRVAWFRAIAGGGPVRR